MRKVEEMIDPKSCLNRALPHERVFVLLERDPTFPAMLRKWIRERIKLGLSTFNSPEIISAKEMLREVIQDTKAALRKELEERS